jgi:hypothetical protein
VTEPARSPWPLGRAIVLYALGWLGFTWPWASGAVTVPWDSKAHFYPQLVFLAETLRGGASPFWTPYVFSGHPQIADPQSLIFSPPFLLLALLDRAPSMTAMDMIVFAALGAGALAVILIFRDRGWHWGGAVVAALVFSFGASAAWRVQHVIQVVSLAHLPIAFLLLDRALARSSLIYGACAGLVAGLMLLGRDQVALVGAYLLVAHAILHWSGGWAKLRASLGPLAVAALVGLAVTALPILMSAQFAAQSNRPAIDYEGAGRGSLHPVHLLTLFFPDLYGSSGPMAEVWGPPSFAWSWTGIFLAQNMFVLYVGAIPILAILTAGLARGWLWARDVRPFTIATLLVLLYALGWYTPFFRAAYEVLPGVALFRRPADATFVLGALLGILGGYVLHRLLTGDVPPARLWRRALEAGLVVAGVVWAVGLALWFERAHDKALVPLATGVVCLGAGALLLVAARRFAGSRRETLAVVLVAATAADLAWNNGPTPSTALPPANFEMLRPDTRDPVIEELRTRLERGRSDRRRDRVELVGLGFDWPNASLVHRLDHTLGYNPLRIGPYAAATGAIDSIGAPDQRQFPPAFPSYRSDLANMLGLRWIVTPQPIESIDRRLAPGALPLVARPGGRYLYENREALPRVVLATNARAADFAAILRDGGWPEVDYQRTVLLDGVDAPPRTTFSGDARLVSYANAEIEVAAQAPIGGGWIVLFDPWHPWWFAEVDGRPAPILRANAIFRAVRVEEGASRVRFTFRPLAGALRQLDARLGRER